jgi:hypothetical protein
MFGLLTRKKKVRPAVRHVRPRLEVLEDRAVPSTVTLNVSYNAGKSITLTGTLTGAPDNANQTILIAGQATGQAVTDSNGNYSITLTASALGNVTAAAMDGSSNTASVTLTDAAPTLTAFTAREGQGDVWTLSGTVTYNRTVTDVTINFGGAPVSIAGKSTTVNGSGNFTLSVQLNGKQTDNGTASAAGTDAWGTVSNTLTQLILQTGV